MPKALQISKEARVWYKREDVVLCVSGDVGTVQNTEMFTFNLHTKAW